MKLTVRFDTRKLSTANSSRRVSTAVIECGSFTRKKFNLKPLVNYRGLMSPAVTPSLSFERIEFLREISETAVSAHAC